jgi:hypothetical protein
MLQTLVQQWQQVEDLKGMLAHMQGQAYTSPPTPSLPDLEALHPRGAARFDPQDAEDRLDQVVGMPHNT